MNIKSIILLLFSPVLLLGQEKTEFSLQEAVAYAREHSYAMLDANDDLAAAKKKVWETTTMGLPQINGSVDYQYYIKKPTTLFPAEFFNLQGEIVNTVQNYFDLTANSTPPSLEGNVPVQLGTKHNLSSSVTLTQLIFDGSYLVGLQSAKVYLKISETIKEKTDVSIKEAVINAYAGVLMTRDGISIMKKNKATIESNLAQTREIVKNGFAEEQDAEQLALTLASIDNQLKNMERLETYNLNMLKYVMGISIEQPVELTQSLEDLLSDYRDLTILGENFDYTNHIDYKISENSLNANQLLVKLEQSKALPSIAAFINYGVSANNEEFKIFSKDQQWFGSSIMGVQMNIPIFSSLMRSSRVQQAKINLDKSERAKNETVEKLNLAYQTAKINYENALETYNTAKEALKLAESIEHKENIKFFEGISGSFELSNAQNQLYGKQQEYLQSIFELISKKAALENALGR